MSAPILHVDLGSPYAYLALERAPAVLGATPEIAPLALGAIFRERGYGSWGDGPDRAAHVAEIERRAAAYGLPPVRWPGGWPTSSLHADRCAVWALRHGRGVEFCRAAYRLEFAEGRDLEDHAALHEAAARAGLPVDELEDAIAAPELKDELKARTAAAITRGVPGVPTLEVGGRLFYGDDHLEEAATLCGS